MRVFTNQRGSVASESALRTFHWIWLAGAVSIGTPSVVPVSRFMSVRSV